MGVGKVQALHYSWNSIERLCLSKLQRGAIKLPLGAKKLCYCPLDDIGKRMYGASYNGGMFSRIIYAR